MECQKGDHSNCHWIITCVLFKICVQLHCFWGCVFFRVNQSETRAGFFHLFVDSSLNINSNIHPFHMLKSVDIPLVFSCEFIGHFNALSFDLIFTRIAWYGLPACPLFQRPEQKEKNVSQSAVLQEKIALVPVRKKHFLEQMFQNLHSCRDIDRSRVLNEHSPNSLFRIAAI